MLPSCAVRELINIHEGGREGGAGRCRVGWVGRWGGGGGSRSVHTLSVTTEVRSLIIPVPTQCLATHTLHLLFFPAPEAPGKIIFIYMNISLCLSQ